MSRSDGHADAAAFATAVNGDGLVIAKFQTKACVVCRRIEPALQGLATRLADQLRVLDVDTEQRPELAARYNVQAVPTLILFRGGAEIGRRNGFQSAGMLRDWVAPYMDD